MWAFNPWDNDSAADWYDEFMDDTKLRSAWLKGINKDATEEFEEVRAAISIYLMLGRVYVWPIDHLDDDLALCIAQSEKILNLPQVQESGELVEQIRAELKALESRKKPNVECELDQQHEIDNKPWWAFWK